MAGQQENKVEWREVILTGRFDTVLYPLDVPELLKQIPAIGYIVPELDLVLQIGTLQEGKALATKGDNQLIINTDRKVLGVKGRDPRGVVDEFREVREFCIDRLEPSPTLHTDFLEFDVRGWTRSGVDPIQVFSRFWTDVTAFKDFSKFFGEDTMNFGLQIVPPRGANSRN